MAAPVTPGDVRQDDEDHDGLLPCKEELWWDTDEDTDAELAGNSEVKEEPDDRARATTNTEVKAEPDASPQPSLPHPRDLWQQLPRRLQPDRYGYERNPAFWFTLNLSLIHI